MTSTGRSKNGATRIAVVLFAVLSVVAMMGAACGREERRTTASRHRARYFRTASPALADAYVLRSKPKRNFGRRTRLFSDAAPQARVYLRFRVPKRNARVAHATLRLYAVDGSHRGGKVFRVTRRWRERGLRWKGRPALRGAIHRIGRVRTKRRVIIDVSRFVTGPGTFSFAIARTSRDRATYVSREGRRRLRPRLVVVWDRRRDPVIAAAGDIACDPGNASFNHGAGRYYQCRQRRTSRTVIRGRYTAVLVLGDVQYDDGAAWKFRRSYDMSWGKVKPVTHPAPGNHDYETRHASGYFKYFGRQAGPGLRSYYSFNLGGWHIVSLNSDCWAIGGCGVGDPEQVWLAKDLARHATRCTLAYWHHPLYSSDGGWSYMAAVWRTLYVAGADVVLSGHAHHYERFAPQDPLGRLDRRRGIREFIVGTGGRSLYRFLGDRAPHSRARYAHGFGILRLVLHPTSFSWRFVPSQKTRFRDAGRARCHR